MGSQCAVGYRICFTSDSINNAGFIYKRFIVLPQLIEISVVPLLLMELFQI